MGLIGFRVDRVLGLSLGRGGAGSMIGRLSGLYCFMSVSMGVRNLPNLELISTPGVSLGVLICAKFHGPKCALDIVPLK